ncbi:30S ribosomal protein S3 [Candidatus Riesia pediculicola]|uniref:30S ribosomal protein S3 n=1 Tax=Candidatus Riesia pediculicola TaxID=401619 RepID=UPI0009C1C7C9|nr:30S ribosomal protein S3 [Candidatus Riesia pediculicola]ARC54494.1 30S ribosomal protein S3 [Candidatus Riesia pediculicola]
MGQKSHPNGLRLGIIRNWNSTWYAGKKTFSSQLISDLKVRNFLKKSLKKASISKIFIERPSKSIRVTIYSARPGIIIGKKGEDIEKLRKNITKITGVPSQVNISEIRKPELDAKLVAESIASQIEKRIIFRRVIKRSIQNTMRSGAQGIKIEISGRLGGSEIARTEWNREGRIPLHTLRADIDFSTSKAKTTYGIIGVKVWIFKGEIFGNSLISDKLEKHFHIMRKKKNSRRRV